MAVAALPLAQYTCYLVLKSDSPMLLQKLPPEGQPIPAQLAWSPWLYRALMAIGGMPMAGALGIYIGLAACGAYAAVRAINPTFRVTTGVDWDRTLLFRTYMHTAPLIKVVVTAVPSFVAAFAVYALLRVAASGSEGASALLAGAVFGAAGWIALSRDGVIGDCDSGNYQLPPLRTAANLALRGAALGISVWLVISAASEASAERLIRLAVVIGGAGERAWWGAAAASLMLGALAGGVLAVGVGLMHWRAEGRMPKAERRNLSGSAGASPSHGSAGASPSHGSAGASPSHGSAGASPSHGSAGASPSHGSAGASPSHGSAGASPSQGPMLRFGLLATAVACYVHLASGLLPAYVRQRYDFDLRTGAEVRPSWWRADSSGPRLATLVAVGPETLDAGGGAQTEWIVSPIAWSGASGLDLGPVSMERLEAHLSRRAGRTALQRPGAVARYDRACLELDLAERLKVLVQSTRATGDPMFSRLLLEDLALLAGAPEAAETLSALRVAASGSAGASPSPLFIFPTDDARIPVGDLLAGHGDPGAARRWYEQGGMPAQRAVERAARLVKIARAEVLGSLTLPPGDWQAKVGLFPAYGSLGRRIVAAGSAGVRSGSAEGRSGSAEPRPPSEPRPPIGPFALRDIIRVGEPDREGRFAIRNVQAGAYRMVVWLRPPAGDALPGVSVISSTTSAGLIECDGYSDVRIGDVRVAVSPRATGAAGLRSAARPTAASP